MCGATCDYLRMENTVIDIAPGARLYSTTVNWPRTTPPMIVVDGADDVMVVDTVDACGARGFIVKFDDGEEYVVHSGYVTDERVVA
jgi:hypothetical protein